MENTGDVEIVEVSSSSSALPGAKDDPMGSQNDTNEDKNSAIDRAYIMDNILKKGVAVDDPNLKLLNFAMKYPCLYDRKHEKYNDPIYTTEIWKDIAQQMNRKHGEVKRKFKSLLLRFGNTYWMLRNPDLVSQGYPKKKFVYYEDMLILKKHICAERAKKRIRIIVKSHKKEEKLKKTKKEKQEAEVKPFMQSMESESSHSYQRRPAEPDIFQRRPETHSSFEMNMPASSGPPPSQYHQTMSINQMDPRSFSMSMGSLDVFNFNQSNQLMDVPGYVDETPSYTSGRSFDDKIVKDYGHNRVEAVDDSHIDYFFKSVCQQVKKKNISDKNFMDLQFAIMTAVSCKLSTYYK